MAHNWKAIVSPTEAFTDVGLYVKLPFSPTRTVKLVAEATERAEAAATREKNFIVKECAIDVEDLTIERNANAR